MSLLTKQDLKNLPELYETEEEIDPIVHVKLFHPMGKATWLLTEYNQKDKIAFGYAYITDGELGYISLEEIENLEIGGLRVERDNWFTPKKLSEAKQELNL
jgi:5-formaminoimidazole-4-carboxamide-1-beta-D-ribofuranosyl 5'-monophosphate synthetase